MRGYCLCLADGTRWNLVADKRTSLWLKKLARIMGLQEMVLDNKEARCIFCVERKPARLVHGWEASEDKVCNIWKHPAYSHVICEISPSSDYVIKIIQMWKALYPLQAFVLKKGGLPLHAALVEKDGKGYLLSATGGTGKSTCCLRIPAPWKAWSDDEVMVVKGSKRKYFVHSLPTWSDYVEKRSRKSWSINASLPLAGMFFLKQAKHDSVKPLLKAEAVVLTTRFSLQACRRTNVVKNNFEHHQFIDNICQLVQAVPAYVLEVSLQGTFWKEMEKVI